MAELVIGKSTRLDKPLERCNIIAGSEDIFGIVFGIGMVELVIGKSTELISLIQRYYNRDRSS